jgi:hypothetical protein
MDTKNLDDFLSRIAALDGDTSSSSHSFGLSGRGITSNQHIQLHELKRSVADFSTCIRNPLATKEDMGSSAQAVYAGLTTSHVIGMIAEELLDELLDSLDHILTERGIESDLPA